MKPRQPVVKTAGRYDFLSLGGFSRDARVNRSTSRQRVLRSLFTAGCQFRQSELPRWLGVVVCSGR